MYEAIRKCYQKINQEILKLNEISLQIMYYLTFPHSGRSVTKFACCNTATPYRRILLLS